MRERWESLAALVRLADDLAGGRPGARRCATSSPSSTSGPTRSTRPTVEGVTLASLHAAKGLEWDAVFLVGLTEGMMPITYAETPEQVEEERRLLYVGVTRARAAPVAVLGAGPLARRPRQPAAVPVPRRPARVVVRSRRRPAPGPGPRKGPGGLPGLRQGADGGRRPQARALRGCPSAYDEALFERLREWRAEQAQEASVPAYVVFTDATLIALAEVRPTTSAQLLAISGVGRTKLERYGADVLALCAGEPAPSAGTRR